MAAIRTSAFALSSRAAPRSIFPAARPLIASYQQQRPFKQTASKMAGNPDKIIATLDTSLIPRLPASAPTLFEAKKAKSLTFEQIASKLGRDEVAVAALFYGQAKASPEDVKNLSSLLDIPQDKLESQLAGFPDRGRTMDMPPKEPLIYRLFEIVQNYGYAYKAVINEKFGDGIMSAISYSTNVKKEEDDKGTWVVITLRGKWLPFTRF